MEGFYLTKIFLFDIKIMSLDYSLVTFISFVLAPFLGSIIFDIYFKYLYNKENKRGRKKQMENVQSIVDLVMNNGLGVICVIYMIYFQMTTMKEMSQTISKMNTSLELITDRLENIENNINMKGN
jgi:predicted PurR-regulated permease PerM